MDLTGGRNAGAARVVGQIMGAVESVTEIGLSGFCHDPARGHRPAEVVLTCGSVALGRAFALLAPTGSAGEALGRDCGFRLRWRDLDAPLVRRLAAERPDLEPHMACGTERLPALVKLPNLAELAARLDAPAPGEAPDLASRYAAIAASGLFDEPFYLERYPDVASAAIDPLFHYLVAGEAEGRQPSYYFDPAFYAAAAGEGAGLVHYLEEGAASGHATSLHFDGRWYAETEVVPPDMAALAHYLADRRRRGPNRLFDPQAYLGRYPDLAGLADPYLHFAEWGVLEGRQAGEAFHPVYYAQTYLAGSGQNPLLHYLTAGRALGHHPAPSREGRSVAAEIRTFTQPGPHFEADPVAAIPGPSDVKTFAFYLPQFHPIAENDAFWGTGFTEWRNLARGQPRFAGHYQPRTPRDLGFYDLTDREAIRAQVRAAETAGLTGFCYYFYWFNGRRVLEKPLDLFVADETLAMPFCLMWANENWTRRWDGQEQDVLLRQDYDPAHDEQLFDTFAGYMASPRYHRVGGRPLLLVYRPGIVPDAPAFFRRLRAGIEARLGVEPLLFMTQAFGDEDPRPFGLDGAVEFPPHKVTASGRDVAKRQHVLDWSFTGQVFDYAEIAAIAEADRPRDFPLIKTVLPMWDNDARKQGAGLCIHGSTPDAFARWFEATCETARRHPVGGEPHVFVNAWNEWAEGTYLEPDLHYGWAYLNSLARVLSKERPAEQDSRRRVLLVGHDAFPAGAQYLLLHIGRQLADFGIAVTFYLLGDGELLPAYRAVAPVVLASDEEAGTFLPRARREGYGHALTNTSASGALVPWLKSHGFQVVSLVHELPSLIAAYRLEQSCAAIAEGSDHVVFASTYVAERFYGLVGIGEARGLIREQGLYGETATAPPEAGREVRAELGLPPGARLVIGVGYGDLRKGVDLFATLARQMAASDPGLHFAWVGALDPAVGTWIGADRDRAASPNLQFLGHRADVARFYAAADLVVLPSREDPYPTVVLEALAAGLGVVGFEGCGGFGDLLSDPMLGRLVAFGDLDGFVGAVREMLARSADPGLRRRRADFVAAHFGWGDYVFDLARILFPDLQSVSVVVPNFDYARYLAPRLASIFGQTYPVREIIVLDDASRDASVAAVEQASEAAGRSVELVVNARNSGNVFRQWKKGLDLIRGDLVWIAEADDESHPGFLARMVEALSSHDAPGDGRPGFAFTDSEAIDEGGRVLYDSYKGYYASDGDDGLSADGRFAAADFLRRFLTARNLVLNVSAIVWRTEHLREVFRRLGPEAFAFRCAGDWRVYVESCRAGGEVAYVAEPLNRHRRHGSSVTHALAKPEHYDEIRRVQAIAMESTPPDPALAERAASFQATLRESWKLAERDDLAA